MKILFVSLYFLLDISVLKGQQRVEELQHILLKFYFPSFYNNYNKFCCKLFPGECYKLLDSAGYTCNELKGRVTKREGNGWVEFQISDVHVANSGFYRCGILGVRNQIYSDYFVEVFEVSDPSHTQPAQTATIKTPKSSTRIPDLSAVVVSQDYSDNIRAPWSFGLPLIVVLSLALMILVTAMITVVGYKVKVRRKKSDRFGETQRESLKREAPVGNQSLTHSQDMSGVIYTTVDFRPHQKPEGVYANLRVQKGPVPDTAHTGMVEYSTLAV